MQIYIIDIYTNHMLYESFYILYEERFIFCVFVFTLSLISMVKGYGKKHTYSKYYNDWFCMHRIYLCISTQRTVSLLFLYVYVFQIMTVGQTTNTVFYGYTTRPLKRGLRPATGL